MDDETFADRLITEEKVALIPGSIFGKSGINHVRICYATDYAVLEEAFSRIGRFVKRHAGNGHSPK
jgi:aminotransferase